MSPRISSIVKLRGSLSAHGHKRGLNPKAGESQRGLVMVLQVGKPATREGRGEVERENWRRYCRAPSWQLFVHALQSRCLRLSQDGDEGVADNGHDGALTVALEKRTARSKEEGKAAQLEGRPT